MNLYPWRKFVIPPLVVAIWVFGAGIGIRLLFRYSYTVGTPATPPQTWPSGSEISRSDRSRLILFVHPQCPCSQATMGELGIIMARCQKHADAYVYFYSPHSMMQEWKTSDLRRDAARIPGVKTLEDVDGRESRRFGAATSGQALLYGSGGDLLFKGGITISRGHSASNNGRDAVVDILEDRLPRQRTASVFGCSLSGPEERGKLTAFLHSTRVGTSIREYRARPIPVAATGFRHETVRTEVRL